MLSDDSDSIPVLRNIGEAWPATLNRSRASADDVISLRVFARIVILGVVYYLAARAGLAFAIPPGNATAVWPASGIALSALLLFGRRLWPGIWLAAFLASASTTVSTNTAMMIATGNTMEALLAAYLCQRLPEDRQPIYSISGAFLLLLIGAVSAAVAAAVGSSSLVFGGNIVYSELSANLATWWLGDLTGIMVVTPFALTLRHPISWPGRSLRAVEQILSLSILALISHAIFGGWLPENIAEGFLYLPLLVLFWMILRLEPILAYLGTLMLAAIAIIGTSHNSGAFATESSQQSLFDLQFFLNAYAVAGLVLAGIVNSERASERQSKELMERLHASRSRLRIARTIQSQLLPESPMMGPGYQCAGGCRPAEETGGDYFDFIREDDGSVVLVIGDVCGHGVGAAMLMTETRAYLRATLADRHDLTDVLKGVNLFLQDDLSSNSTSVGFVTLFICRFRPRTATLEYVGAGHQGFVVRSSGEIETLDSATIPLGLTTDFDPAGVRTVPLKPKDLVMLITDGVTEAKSSTGDFFRMDRLSRTVVAASHNTVQGILTTVMDQVTQFTEGTPQEDDMTAAFMRVTPKNNHHN